MPCIESLLGQTLKECEFIFINDGSSDKSPLIIEQYRNSDHRIKLVNQDNKGVSVARNKGVYIAAGEYIGFVDADDYIKEDMYEVLYNAAKLDDCDMIISNFESEMNGQWYSTKYPFPMNTRLKKNYIEQELIPYFISTDYLNSVCNKLFKKNIILQNSVTFPEGVTLGEDGLFNMHFLNHASTTKYLNYTGYSYREVMGSATRNISEKDYFRRSLEVYTAQISKKYIGNSDIIKVGQLKAIKLITSVMSYVHIYLTPSNNLDFKTRYNYVKNMISDKHVREALPVFYNEKYQDLGRYERFIVSMIKNKSILGLYLATAYSRLRNG